MSLLAKLIGKRYITQAVQYIPSAGLYGTTGFVLGCYFFDWKLVLQYVPYYNTKFPIEVAVEE